MSSTSYSSHEPIHSGHFMTSDPHTDTTPESEDEVVDVEVDDDDKPAEDNVSKANKAELYEKPVTFYKFGPRKTQSIAIDVSLNKLNKCIKVAYNKMTTPKWKDFKGLRLHWKQRIRLNNVIWRAYYMEFRKPVERRTSERRRRAPYCYFSVPDDDNTHNKIEGSLVEGMYWKRRMEAVCAQYKRWRHFMKTRRAGEKRRRERSGQKNSRQEVFTFPPQTIQRSMTPKNNVSDFFDADDLENVFTDELFESLNQPYMFPNPREIMPSGNADIMQPGLLSLQPSLEEIMSSLDAPDNGCGGTSSSNASVTSTGMGVDGAPNNHILGRTRSWSMEGTMSHRGGGSNSGGNFPHFAVPAPPQQQMTHHTLTRVQTSSDRPSDYSAKDYVAASMLVDYSNQSVAPSSSQRIQQPTRLPSQITSQMLMMSSGVGQPQYSQASHYQHQSAWKGNVNGNSFLVTGGDVVPNVDYMPQFLQRQGQNHHGGVHSQQGTSVLQNTSSMVWPRTSSSSHGTWLDQLNTSPISHLQTQTPSPMSSSPLSALTPQPGPPPPSLGLSGPPLSTAVPSPNLMRANNQGQGVHGSSSLQKIGALNTPRTSVPHSKPQLIVDPLITGPSSLAERLGRPSLQVLHPVKCSSIGSSGRSSSTCPLMELTSSSSTSSQHQTFGNSAIVSSGQSYTREWSTPTPATEALLTQPRVTTPGSAPVTTYRDEKGPWALLLNQSGPSSADPAPSSTKKSPPIQSLATPSTSSSAVVHSASSPRREVKTEVKDVQMVHGERRGGARVASKQVDADSTLKPSERKRILHLHAEQNRRSALKDGFDQLMELLPDLYSGGVKPTNAVVLAKAAEQIRALQAMKQKKMSRKTELEERVAHLGSRISALQSTLPSGSGTSSAVDVKTQVVQFAERHMKERAKEHWNYWVFAKMMEPMIQSFAANVHPDANNKNEVSISVAQWFCEHWKIHELRPLASSILVYLATNTRVLSDPSTLQGHVQEQLNKNYGTQEK